MMFITLNYVHIHYRVVDNNDAEADLEERSCEDDKNDFELLDKIRDHDNKM